MTWVAFERAIRIARKRGLPAPVSRWRAIADMAYESVQRDSWNPGRGVMCNRRGAGAGRVPADNALGQVRRPSDPRFLATLDRIADELVADNLVRRYKPDGSDGLEGSEGTFNMCSFWYVEALTRAGRREKARNVFE